MTSQSSTQLHATCVALEDVGVLILGPSGAGKSDLALRLIDVGAQLVADDRTDVRLDGNGALIASAPDILRGRLEVRGIGIVPLAPERLLASAPLGLALRLSPAETQPRLPEPQAETILGHDLAVWHIDPEMPSAPARVRLLVNALKRGIVRFDDDPTT